MDDIGLGEIALLVRTKDCNVRRLDLSGNFGNRGVKIFAEALKTNTSLKTVSFGCYKVLNDSGGQALLYAVDPFSEPTSEWENITNSNHTLQSIYILDLPTVSVNRDLISKLQSISISGDSHRTLQIKVWRHMEENIEDISHMGLETKHMPYVIFFVYQHGAMDQLFQLLRSRNTPVVSEDPLPERVHMIHQIIRIKRENEILKEKNEELHKENKDLHNLFRFGKKKRGCMVLMYRRLADMWRLIVELLFQNKPHK
jgi:hypothetical protein